MSRFKLLYFVIFIINLYKINAQISDKRLCVDEECKVPISLAKTLLRYSSPDSRILSFAPNIDITIYSKSAGSREDLWGGEIDGKRGYVPKHMVRETKILQKPTLLVDTEFNNATKTKQVPSKVEPDKVQEPYEVVDGTTIYLTPQDAISPTSIDSPIQSTALPVETNKVTRPDVEASVKDDGIKTETSSSKNQKEEVASLSKIEEVEDSNVNTKDESNEIKNKQEETSGQVAENEEEEIEDENDEVDVDDDEDDISDGEEESEEPEETSETEKNQDQTDELNSDSQLETQTETTNTSEAPTITQNVKSSEDIVLETIPDSGIQHEAEKVSSEIQPEEPLAVVADEPVKEESKKESENPKILVSSKPSPSVLTENESGNSTPEENATGNDEPAVSPNIEATTLTPEIEVPEPFLDSFIEVTQNPLEVTEDPIIIKETVPTLPPLGLFGGFIADSILSGGTKDVQQEQHIDEEVEEPVKPTKDVQQEQKIEEAEELVKPADSELGQNPIDPLIEIKENVTEEIPEEVVEEAESVSAADLLEEVKVSEDKSTEQSDWTFNENQENQQVNEGQQNEEESSDSGFLGGVLSLFGSGLGETVTEETKSVEKELTSPHISIEEEKHVVEDDLLSTRFEKSFCDASVCPKSEEGEDNVMDFFNFNSDVFLYLVTTAVSVIIFLFGYVALDKSKREGPLIAKINNLEKELLIVLKENQILQEKISTDSGYETNDRVSSEVVESLKQDLLEMTNIKNAFEEQVQLLEKELENSTEVGMELNRMLSEILQSESGSDVLKANVENLQRQLIEQQTTVNSVNETLAITNTENHELRLELELSNKKVLDLQAELDKLLLNILKIEEEKDTQQSTLENEIVNLRQRHEEINNKLKIKEENHIIELKQLRSQLDQTERKLELKSKEHDVLSETFKKLKTFKNNDETLRSFLEVGGIKAEYQLLKTENQRFIEKLQQEQELKLNYEKKAQAAFEELKHLREKYEEADKLRVESQTKLEVLSNYFKDREAQWQKEISKHEALWAEREGEATSTTERIRFMQEQLQNYKAQTESLKQEIMSQEIELKSQISVLEKKAHENWVSVRQAERKLEEAKQEAAQLRHRLTLRERAIQEDKNQHRLQSSIDQNGDMPMSPLESPASPPLLYGARDHITKSPALPGLPPFLPPPPGVPFMPPPIHGVPPFIPPPPPNMFPGDHRPPPLGRMSSPPLNSRYSPSSRGYSPYDRNSSSPSDSEYGTSPPHRRGYSPFNNRSDDRRDYKRAPPGRNNGRNIMKGGGSSGSGHSNESLEKISRQQSKV